MRSEAVEGADLGEDAALVFVDAGAEQEVVEILPGTARALLGDAFQGGPAHAADAVEAEAEGFFRFDGGDEIELGQCLPPQRRLRPGSQKGCPLDDETANHYMKLAKEALLNSLPLADKDNEIPLILGQLCVAGKEFDDAETYFKKAAETVANPVEALFGLCEIYGFS